MFGGGNTPTTSGQYGFGVSSYTMDYFSAQYHRFRYGLSIGGTNFGAVGMELNNNNLTVNGSIYAATTIQSSGAYYFPNGIWNKSNDSIDRLHFSTNGATYIKSGVGALGQGITFRNSNDQDLAYFNGFYTTYYYRDEARNKGNGKVYGFITQQIQEVIPDAVSITKDIIANIYKTCLIYNKREIYHCIPQDVEIDTEVMIYDKQYGKGKRYKIKEIYDDHFVIDEDIEGDECFVFGYEVNDLNAIDKSYIYTLNVCATQELHRRMQAQEARIQELERKLEMVLLSVINNN
jgi:hypothetical protein